MVPILKGTKKMKMKQITIVLLFIFFAASNIFAQEKKFGTNLSEIKSNKHHVELDVKNVFRGLSSASVIYKRALQRDKKEDKRSLKLLRFIAGFNGQSTLSSGTATSLNSVSWGVVQPFDYQGGFLRFGLEQQKMNKYFVHYYGIDGIVNFYRIGKTYSNDKLIDEPPTLSDFTKTRRFGVNPFFGVKYYFAKCLSIGIETGFAFYYFNRSISRYDVSPEYDNGETKYKVELEDPEKSNGIQASYSGLQFLTIGFTF